MNGRTVALACLVALASANASAAQTTAGVERFTFAVPHAPEGTLDGSRFQLTVDRWSTDAERDAVRATIADDGSKNLLDAFRGVSGVGHLRWPGGLEYTVRYARQTTRADGGIDIVLVADRPVWAWWDATLSDAARSSERGYSVVQLRLDKAGRGEGRLSLSGPVSADPHTGVTMGDYEKQPVLLNDVLHERT